MGVVRGRRRGQSQVLGVVVLFALVMTVSGVVVTLGGGALEDANTGTTVEGATATMLELQSAATSDGQAGPRRVSFAGGGGASAQAVHLSDAESVRVLPEAGHVTVTVYDDSAGTATTVVDEDLGKIVYEKNGRTVAYQANGVFRKHADGEDSRMVSPPPFVYQGSGPDPTLSLGFATVRASGNHSTGGSFTVARTGTERAFPNASHPSPLEGDDAVEITIESEYIDAWGEFFGARTGVDPDYDRGAGEVTITLSNPPDPDTVVGPLISVDPNGLVDVRNQMVVDSYDSRDGSYASQSHGEAPVYVRSDIEIAAGAELDDVYAGGYANVSGQAGNVYHDGPYVESAGASATDAGPVPFDSMPTIENHDDDIDDAVAAINASNDNATASATIDDIENANCGETAATACVLSEGDYYVENVDLNDDDRLRFEPAGGRIRVALTDGLSAEQDSQIRVVGSGTVVVYSQGDLDFRPGSSVTNPGQDARQFRIWQRSDGNTHLGSTSVYVGLLHAGPSGNVSIRPNNAGHIYGALIGDFTGPIGAGRPIHFDESLRNVTGPGETAAGRDQVVYLRVTRTDVNVTA